MSLDDSTYLFQLPSNMINGSQVFLFCELYGDLYLADQVLEVLDCSVADVDGSDWLDIPDGVELDTQVVWNI